MGVTRKFTPTLDQVLAETKDYELVISAAEHEDHLHYGYGLRNKHTHVEEQFETILPKAQFSLQALQGMSDQGFEGYVQQARWL